MSLLDIFKPRPDKFVQLLIEQARLTHIGLELLQAYMENQEPEIATRLGRTEKEADEVRRILIEELMRTFVTPFDREDIFSLSREIDDILDYANTTVDEMEILKVKPTVFMQRMAVHLHDASVELHLAVQRLQDKHYTVANEHVRRAKALENRVETLYREALADLFRGPKDPNSKDTKFILNILKTREIYRHMSNSADREDTAANVIADIIMKVS